MVVERWLSWIFVGVFHVVGVVVFDRRIGFRAFFYDGLGDWRGSWNSRWLRGLSPLEDFERGPPRRISQQLMQAVDDREEFQLAFFKNSKKENLFANRIFQLFDLKQRGAIDFSDFVKFFNVFHPHTSLEDKVNFEFKLYDLDDTSFIERTEVPPAVNKSNEPNLLINDRNKYKSMLIRTFVNMDDWRVCIDYLHGPPLHLCHGGGDPNFHS